MAKDTITTLHSLWVTLRDSEDSTGCSDELTVIENPVDDEGVSLIDRMDLFFNELVCG